MAPEDYEKLNFERINSKGYRLPCNAELYSRDLAAHDSHHKKLKSEKEKDEHKNKIYSDKIFDASPYLSFLQKKEKENEVNSNFETASNKNSNLPGSNASSKLPKIV